MSARESAVRAGTLEQLRAEGHLLTKVGPLPVVVFDDGGELFAIEDRCPHMGFPLHRGTVECGLVTCHWHHARFDLASGGTLDPWADDTRAFDVHVEDGAVFVRGRPDDERARLEQRLREGLEDDLTLVIAKSVLGLVELGADPLDIVRQGLEFGTTYRSNGWGAGLTVLVAMSNVLPYLDPADRSVALVHALRFVANDTAGHAPRFPVAPLPGHDVPADRLEQWYRRFIDTRSSDSAERSLRTAIDSKADLATIEQMMVAAITDHVFIDEGHTLDFTNKGFEALALVGDDAAANVLPTLVAEAAGASRSEESSEWQYPHDLVALSERTVAALEAPVARATDGSSFADSDIASVAQQLLADDPEHVAAALVAAHDSGASDEQLAHAVAHAAALRIARFHVQNDHADWNTVHHAFTAANGLHHSAQRGTSAGTRRAIVQCALRVYLDRFLNIPPARPPRPEPGGLDALRECFEVQGEVDHAANLVAGCIADGVPRADVIAALGRALLNEDAGFHWYQVYEASVRQSMLWPETAAESTIVLSAFARFLTAHTPTRRELPKVITIAARLRRGEHLFEEE
jgi:nitrite reductase/ring-hydroxylating ferredoxin subunit